MDVLRSRYVDQTRKLCDVALAGLANMIDPASGLFVQRVDGDDAVPSGASLRYTAIALLGLERAERAGYAIPVDVGKLYEAVGATVAGAEDLGDVGLVLWASAATCAPIAERALRELLDFDDVVKTRAGEVVHTTELAWVVTGLAEALMAGIGQERDVRRRLDRAYAYLLGQRGPSGLFCFSRPRGRRPRSPIEVVRSELGFFDAQVYGIVACLARDAAIGDPEAREVARAVGERLLVHQHPLGQWGWHYNVRTGTLVDLYPVYSVHQDGMAPMALLWLERVTGVPTTSAVARGVAWLFGHNELGASLVDDERGVVWRSIRRRGARRRLVYPLKATSLLRIGRGLDLGARAASSDALEVDRECRPYHLGFCLYALAELESAPMHEAAMPLEEPRPTLRTGELSPPSSGPPSSGREADEAT
jgi:hypothetical protein